MKKFIPILFAAILLQGCVAHKSLDLRTLTFGMTVQEVIQRAGRPQRVLSVRNTPDGRQEILQFQTAQREVFALEFWDNYLTGFEFLYDDISYVIPPRPPVHFPPRGRPIYVFPNRPPNRPGFPSQPNRPTLSTGPGRPLQPGRPNPPDQSTPARPGRPAQLPETPSKNESTRPTESEQGQPEREQNNSGENKRDPQEGTRSTGRAGGR